LLRNTLKQKNPKLTDAEADKLIDSYKNVSLEDALNEIQDSNERQKLREKITKMENAPETQELKREFEKFLTVMESFRSKSH